MRVGWIIVVATLLRANVALCEDEYAFVLRARGNPYWQSVKEGIEETARAKGVKAIVYESETDRASEEQLNICNAAIERKPKFIAIAAANANLGIQCLKRAAAKGIKIADIDGQIPFDEAEKQGVNLAFSIGSDNLAIGREAALYAAANLRSDTPEIFILEGAAGAVAGKQRVDGFTTELLRRIPGAVLAGSVSAEWDRLKAMNITADILQRTPSLDLIYAANDMMALGAVEALRTAGRLHQVKVIGVDGTADARRSVAKGEMTATVAQLPYLIGSRVLELGVLVSHNHTVSRVERTETPVLTRETLEDKAAPYNKYLR